MRKVWRLWSKPPNAGQRLVQRRLAGVAERAVAEVVRQRHRLGQILVDAERPRQRAGDLRHLERVGEPGAVVVALEVDEDLRLVLEPAERGRVDDPVAVALERVAQRRSRARARRGRGWSRGGRRRALAAWVGKPGPRGPVPAPAWTAVPRCLHRKRRQSRARIGVAHVGDQGPPGADHGHRQRRAAHRGAGRGRGPGRRQAAHQRLGRRLLGLPVRLRARRQGRGRRPPGRARRGEGRRSTTCR